MPVDLVRRSTATVAALASLTIALYACEDDPLTVPPEVALQVVTGVGADPGAACSPVVEVPFLADGGTVRVGSVLIANDEADVYVTFQTSGGWEINKSSLFIGDADDRIPLSGGGNPRLGQFPWSRDHVGGTPTYTYAVPRAEFEDGDPLTAAAHAEVRLGERVEGAWADGDPIRSGRSWATAFTYTPASCASDLPY